jgi:hypothetical protein
VSLFDYYDDEELDEVRANARQRRIFVVCWTWQGHRVVRTKTEGQRLVKVWKKWQERKGWSVQTRGEAYFAFPPEWDHSTPTSASVRKVHVIYVGEYDYDTLERLPYKESSVARKRQDQPAGERVDGPARAKGA